MLSSGICNEYLRSTNFNMRPKLKPEQIVLLRKKLQKTQAQFAEMLAVDPVTISRWENGARRPRPVYARELERLANG